MDEEQRVELSGRIKEQRISQFGTITAAIRAASINTETWNRAERGEKIRDDRMAAIVKVLWPHSGGMWNRIDDPVEAPRESAPAPVGAGVDPEVLADLNDLEPDQVQRVKDFIRGIKSSQ